MVRSGGRCPAGGTNVPHSAETETDSQTDRQTDDRAVLV